MSGSPAKPQTLTEKEAIEVAGSIRDKLVQGAKLIEENAAALTTILIICLVSLFMTLTCTIQISWNSLRNWLQAAYWLTA